MRAWPLLPILFLAPLFAEPDAACASPFFLHALSDSDLAANSAGRAITLRIAADAEDTMIALPGFNIAMTQNVFGVTTVIRDTGTASVSQAAFMLTLKATLNNTQF